MELRHLRYFVAVARKHHFTQAAEELFIAQPALSQQIQALERELGVVLFERTSRSVQLTAAGEALLARAERILIEVEQTQTEMQAFAGLMRGRVSIGVLQSLSTYRLPALLAAFHQHYEEIEIVLHEDVTESLIERLRSGLLDVALTHSIGTIFPFDASDPQISAEPVLSEEIVLVVGPHHPFAQRKEVTPEELRNEAFILFKPGSGLRRLMVHLSATAGFSPRVLFESGDVGTIRALVAEGLGISVLPRSAVEVEGKEIVLVRLNPPPPPRTVLLTWHKRIAHSLAATAFLNFFREEMQHYMQLET